MSKYFTKQFFKKDSKRRFEQQQKRLRFTHTKRHDLEL